MKRRWLSLYVENEVGVLARVAGLFSGKSYNLHSLTVGETEDTTVSRMTICVEGDDATFEQIKKQLNRLVEVIKVVDLSNKSMHIKEVLYLKVKNCTEKEKIEVLRIADVFHVTVVDYGKESILLECLQTEQRNNDIVAAVATICKQMEVVRGGSVAVESISITER